MSGQLRKKCVHGKQVAKAHGQGDVLSFCCAECNLGLNFADPMNWTARVNNDITSVGNGGTSKLRSGMRSLSGKITVNISIETVVTGWLQNQTTFPGEVKVAAKILDCILVSPIWVVDIPHTHGHSH